jgi:hypothetical protein
MGLLHTPLDFSAGKRQGAELIAHTHPGKARLAEETGSVGRMNADVWRESAINSFHGMSSNRGDFHFCSCKRAISMHTKPCQHNATPWRVR